MCSSSLGIWGKSCYFVMLQPRHPIALEENSSGMDIQNENVTQIHLHDTELSLLMEHTSRVVKTAAEFNTQQQKGCSTLRKLSDFFKKIYICIYNLSTDT